MGKCLQIIFGFVNFLLWVCGLALLGLSIWLLVDPGSFFEFAEDVNVEINQDGELPHELLNFTSKIMNGLYLAIAAASLLVIVGFLGCCGASRRSGCMLNAYAIIMILSILLQIAVGVLIFVYSSDVDNVMLKSIEKFDPNATSADDKVIEDFWTTLQTEGNCCGWTDAANYQNNIHLENNGTVPYDLPPSCCSGNTTCTSESMEESILPCSDILRAMGWIVGGIAIGCVVVEVLATVAACCIRKKENNKM